MAQVIHGQAQVSGSASGRVLFSLEPLSFWGGYDQFTGEIIDRRHPLSGQHATGCILAVSASRGSSTTTAVLLEAVRQTTAPAAILTIRPDTFITLASVVADELYGKPFPVLSLGEGGFLQLQGAASASLSEAAVVTIPSA